MGVVVVLQCPRCGAGVMPGATACTNCMSIAVEETRRRREEEARREAAAKQAAEERIRTAIAELERLGMKPTRRTAPGVEVGRLGRVRAGRRELPAAWQIGQWEWVGSSVEGAVRNSWATGVTAGGKVVRLEVPEEDEAADFRETSSRLSAVADRLEQLAAGSLVVRPPLSDGDLRRVWTLERKKLKLVDRVWHLENVYGTLEKPKVHGAVGRQQRKAFKELSKLNREIADLDSAIAQIDPEQSAHSRGPI